MNLSCYRLSRQTTVTDMIWDTSRLGRKHDRGKPYFTWKTSFKLWEKFFSCSTGKILFFFDIIKLLISYSYWGCNLNCYKDNLESCNPVQSVQKHFRIDRLELCWSGGAAWPPHGIGIPWMLLVRGCSGTGGGRRPRKFLLRASPSVRLRPQGKH